MSKFSPILHAIRIVFSSKAYQALGAVSFISLFVFYAFMLPATSTGGRVGFTSLQFFSLRLGFFAFIFSFLLALIVSFSVYAFYKKRTCNFCSLHGRQSTSVAGSFLGSILPSLVCCSPLLPTLAGFAGGVFPAIFGVSEFAQGFIATHENQMYLIITAILAYSLYQNAKQVEYADSGICDAKAWSHFFVFSGYRGIMEWISYGPHCLGLKL